MPENNMSVEAYIIIDIGLRAVLASLTSDDFFPHIHVDILVFEQAIPP